MCNMAAYTGKRSAAPILLRMIRNQEFLDAGHYTGIATMDNGRIYMRKICGTAADLLERYPEILDFPGCCGIIHSRTPGIDNEEWSQPFFSFGDEDMVYCANGSNGRFGTPDIREDYAGFIRDGYVFRSAVDEKAGADNMLPDGKYIHTSEFKGFIAKRELRDGELLRHGLKRMFSLYPAEFTALAMRTAEPGAISVLRYNMPMMLGRKDADFYLATSAMALEKEDIRWIDSLPRCSVNTVTPDVLQSEVMEDFLPTLRSWDPAAAIYAEFDRLIDGGKDFSFGELRKTAIKHWSMDKEVGFANPIVYEYLRSRLNDGTLETFDIETVATKKRRQMLPNPFPEKAILLNNTLSNKKHIRQMPQ